MRRVAGITLVLVSLLLSSVPSVDILLEVHSSIVDATLGAEPQAAALPLHSSQLLSPPVSSPPSVAYVANTSSLAYWQRKLAYCVNETRLWGLLTSLTSYASRHPFVADSNASLVHIASILSALGFSYVNDWFCIPRVTWTGIIWLRQQFWTRNLYVTPWGINTSAPSLVVTCHVDSARYTLLGLSTSNAPGANDNAAAITVMLEALQLLEILRGANPQWNIVFAFLGGEESNGTRSLWGSEHFVNHGLPLLGINPTTAKILNIDEIAYKGTLWATSLAIYRFTGEDCNLLLSLLIEAASTLGVDLLDLGYPRVSTLEEVQNDQAWSISEWTFHTHSLPSLTISTDQYPDPYKHTLYDTRNQCDIQNIANVTALLGAVVVALAYPITSVATTHIEDWTPVLASAANLTITDYLDPSLSTYDAIVVDPLVKIDPSVTQLIVSWALPVLAIGSGGAQLVTSLTGSAVSMEGMQALQVQGLKAFHPAINSACLLEADDARVFRNNSVVYAVNPTPHALVLVGNAHWSSMCYFPVTEIQIPLLFFGVQVCVDRGSTQLATNSLTWLLEGNTQGICMGIDKTTPSVGDVAQLYVLVCDLTNWTCYPSQAIQLNISSAYFDRHELMMLVSNDSGVAVTPLFFRHPTPYRIRAQSHLNLSRTLYLTAKPVCSVLLRYISATQQGERQTVSCFVNSSLDYTTLVNLTLFHPTVGSIINTNLLLVSGPNFFQLLLEVLPSCPPGSYPLTFLITTPDLVFFSNQVSLTVHVAFILALVSLPDKTVQNQFFEVKVQVTNLGTRSRVFDVVAESNFWGAIQVIVQPNESRLVTVMIEYLPWTVIDTGMRVISLALFISTNRITAVEAPLYIGYSTINMFITLIPPVFLVALCILGIWWMRNGKQSVSSQSAPSTALSPFQYPRGIRSTQISWGTQTDNHGVQRCPSTPQLQHHLNQVIQQLGLTYDGSNRVANDRVVLAWEKQGSELHIVLQADDPQLIKRVVQLIASKGNTHSLEGERGRV